MVALGHSLEPKARSSPGSGFHPRGVGLDAARRDVTATGDLGVDQLRNVQLLTGQ